MADGYQAQIAPQRTAGSAGQATADNFGGQTFDAISRAGSGLADRVIRETKLEAQREYQREAADAMVRFAKLKEDTDLFDNDARSNTNPGAAGHRFTITKQLDDTTAEFLGGIKNERLRQAYEGRIAEYRGSQVAKADAFERIETIKLIADNSDKATDMIANRLSRGASEKDYADAEIELREGIHDLEGMPDAVKRALEAEGVEKIAISWLGGMEPEASKALMNSGIFDGKISPAAMERLNNNADTEIKRKEIEADAQARLERADATEAINQFQRELEDGIPKSDEEIEEMQSLASQYGLQADVYDLGKSRIQGEANRRFRTATPVQIDAAIKTLTTKIAKAGDKAKGEDVVLRDHLTGMLSRRTDEATNDPLAFAAQSGLEVAPVNFSDPASIDARRRSADATAKALGVPAQYLTAAEAEQYSANLSTVDGRKDVAELASRFGGVAAVRIARQIAPNDKDLQYVVGLPRIYRNIVFEGDKLRGEKGGFAVPATESLEAYREVAPSLKALPADFRSGALESARSIYAYYAARTGKEEFSEALWTQSFDMAVGSTGTGDKKKGGIAEWNGHKFLLPSEFNLSEVRYAIKNSPGVADARTGQGDKISAQGLMNSFFPVAVADGVYRFEDRRGGVVVGKTGRPLEFTIRKKR